MLAISSELAVQTVEAMQDASRKRLWLVVGGLTLLFGGLCLWLASMREGPRGSVTLTFAGFTNYVISTTVNGQRTIVSTPQAIFLIKNHTSVPVEVGAFPSLAVFMGISSPESFWREFSIPDSAGLPFMLRPGETQRVHSFMAGISGTWGTEFSYQRRGQGSRISARLWNTKIRVVQNFVDWVHPSWASNYFVSSGLLTNLLPESERATLFDSISLDLNSPQNVIRVVSEDQPPSLSPLPSGPISDAADATSRAIEIANRAARASFPRKSSAVFDGKTWVWRGMVGRGLGDVEAIVRLNPDGTVAETNITSMGSASPPSPFR